MRVNGAIHNMYRALITDDTILRATQVARACPQAPLAQGLAGAPQCPQTRRLQRRVNLLSRPRSCVIRVFSTAHPVTGCSGFAKKINVLTHQSDSPATACGASALRFVAHSLSVLETGARRATVRRECASGLCGTGGGGCRRCRHQSGSRQGP